jgi:hypothetical protein
MTPLLAASWLTRGRPGPVDDDLPGHHDAVMEVIMNTRP